VQISNSASKANFKLKQGPVASSSQLTFSFLNSKARGKQQTSASNFQSVHPYTVMAIPPNYSSQLNLKESSTLSSMSSTLKKASNRQNCVADPSLQKVPKAFIKSH